MATKGLISKVLEIDIVLAGVEADTTFLTIPNPEGRDLLVSGASLWATTYDSTGDEAYLDVAVVEGFSFMSPTVKGAPVIPVAFGTPVDTGTDFRWLAAANLTLTLGGAAAPTFVGKLYVEYWGSDRVLGTSYSKQHASVYRGIRKALG